MKENKKKNPQTLRRLLAYLGVYKGKLALAIFFTLLSVYAQVQSPKYMGKITTRLFQDVKEGLALDFDFILKTCLFLVVLYCLQGLFDFICGWILVDVSQDLIFKLRKEISEKVRHLPISFYDSHSTGDLLSRMTNDVETLGKNLQQSISRALSGGLLIIGILYMMIKTSPTLTVVFIVTLPLSYGSTKFIAKRSQEFFRQKSQGLGTMVGFIEESFSATDLIKAYGYEEESEKEFIAHNDQLYKVSYKASFMTGIMLPVMTFISNLGYVAICIVGGLEVLKARLLIGDIQAIIQYVRKIGRPIEEIAEMANIFQASLAAGERIFDFLDVPEEVECQEESLDRPIERVDFKDVFFSYDKETPVIQNFSLHVERGQSIAIVGPTGAGKTTLVNLLMRFYDVDQGSISLNGVDIRRVHRDQLRDFFGMVLQDTWLFKGTIRENIAYGKPQATEEEIIQAAKQAYCHNFIQTLPQGYDTELNEEASNISQGQQQLLTIARALLSDPEILILDEATSSVDTRTERLIQKAMNRLLEGRTNFVIAHRLSTIVGADTILVLQDGDIVEKGDHQSLLAQNGIYKGLYTSQFAQEEKS